MPPGLLKTEQTLRQVVVAALVADRAPRDGHGKQLTEPLEIARLKGPPIGVEGVRAGCGRGLKRQAATTLTARSFRR